MKKKIWLTFAGVLSVAFAAAAIELDGYNIFDRADGGNFACSLDPHCRKMTNREIALSKTIFGNAIDYKRVKIFTRPFFFWSPGDHDVAWTLNGNIRLFRDNLKVPDFSLVENISVPKTYLHEMTHVWQQRSDSRFLIDWLVDLAPTGFSFVDLYSYKIDDHRLFQSFNLEQQGTIIEDYYSQQVLVRQNTAGLVMDAPKHFKKSFNTLMRGQCQILDKYEAVISTAFPQSPEPGCAMYRPYIVQRVDPNLG